MISFEIRKIIGQKSIIWILVSLLIMCGLYEFIGCFTDITGSGYTAVEYNTLYDRLREEDRLNLSDISDDITNVYTQNKTVTGNIISELKLYEQIRKEITQTENYTESVNKTLSECEGLISMSIISGDKYTVRNAKKTHRDFEKLSAVEISTAKTYGGSLFFKNGIADFLILAVIFLVGFLYTDEYENNSISLQRCSFTEKKRIAFCKLLAGAGIIFFAWIAVFVTRFIIIAAAYGTEWLFVSVQSIYGCSSSLALVNGLEACGLFFLVKLLVYEGVFCLAALIAVLSEKFIALCAVGGTMLGIFYLLFVNISENSFLSLLKYLNVFAFLDTSSVVFNYRNLNIFGYPLSYLSITVAASLLSIVLAGALTALSYGRIKNTSRRKKRLKLRAFDFKLGATSLVYMELKKWLLIPQVLLSAVVVIICVLSFRFTVTEDRTDLKKVYYRAYIDEISGEYSEDKLNILNAHYDQINEYELLLMLHQEDYPAVVIEQYQSEVDKKDSLLEAIDYAYYLSDREKCSFVNDEGYIVMLGLEQGRLPVFVYRVMSACLMVFIGWYLFDKEKKTGMEKLINISLSGMKKVKRAKYINLLLASIAISAVIWIPWIIQVGHVFDIRSINAPAASLRFLSFVPVSISLLAVLIIFFLLHWLTIFFLGLVSGFISKVPANENVKLIVLLLLALLLPVGLLGL